MSHAAASVQSSQVEYELHSLGWKAFQDLCITVVSEVLGQTVQAFLPSNDGGRDGAFYGQWDSTLGEGIAGSYTVQCKFTGQRNSYLSLADLADDYEKARRLASRGLARTYLLMTNYKVSGVSDEAIKSAFLAIDDIENVLVLGSEWITMKIRESQRLRMLVPRVYGLGDLSQILDERAYQQAHEILAYMREDLAKFVVTDAYKRSAQALLKHGFVILLGEPASGKSTIAASLALGALDVWGCSTIKIRGAEEFVTHWNPNEPKQFFWVDDVFGATQYQQGMSIQWNHVFPHLAAAIRKGARILFTSRDYIFKSAQGDLKADSFPLLRDSQVIINVQELSDEEREQILYNHIKLGNQPQLFKKQIKLYLPVVASDQSFLPETARRLGDPAFTRSLRLDLNSIRDFVQRPIGHLIGVIKTIDKDSRAALALLFMGGGGLDSPITLGPEDEEALTLLGGNLAGVRHALHAMEGSLVRLVRREEAVRWVFRHPTVGDAFGAVIAEDPELLDIYLKGTPIDKMVSEVTCGDVGIQGVKLVVPSSRYISFMEKLAALRDSERLNYFIAFRCNHSFLKTWLDEYPQYLNSILDQGSALVGSSKALIICRLHEFGLLPEPERRSWVERVMGFALSYPDADFLNSSRVRSVFTEQELSQFRERLTSEVLPRMEDLLEEWRDNWSSTEDPKDYFEPLAKTLRSFRNEFEADAEEYDSIDDALFEIDGLIDSLRDLYDSDEDSYQDYDFDDVDTPAAGERSIFDDVDE